MQNAKTALKAYGDAKWKWSKTPGDGVTRAQFQCNAHTDCKCEMRVVKIEGLFHLQAKGEHSEATNLKKRANSVLTFEQEETVRKQIDTGAKPGGILTSLTKTVGADLRLAGMNPLLHKKAEGGLEGARMRRTEPSEDPQRIAMVSYAYRRRIECVPTSIQCIDVSQCINAVSTVDTHTLDVSITYRCGIDIDTHDYDVSQCINAVSTVDTHPFDVSTTYRCRISLLCA